MPRIHRRHPPGPPLSPYLFVLFGATGDLAALKLFPALYRLCGRDDAPDGLRIFGVGRSAWDDARLQQAAADAVVASGADRARADAWARASLRYARVESYSHLTPVFEAIDAVEHEAGRDAGHAGGNRVYYLALPPEAFPGVIEAVGRHEAPRGTVGETVDPAAEPWVRLVIEKPFGTDRASAQALNALVHAHFAEDQVYRIDHFLGKQTVQNLLVFRFANALFESVWSRHQVERVEILVAETNDAAGRAGYFDGVGTLRDMIQNHLTQLFALVAMEPPARLDAEGIRSEKVKVLRSTRTARTNEVVLGQYGAGPAVGDGGAQEAYRDHEGVPPGSTTDTYAAVRLHVDNWRWQGVPFVLATGKRLAERVTEIAVVFHRSPVALFRGGARGRPTPNVLRIRLQPHEGFRLSFDVKDAGDGFGVSTQSLEFSYEDVFGAFPDAYETLLHDVAEGDPTLFVHADEAEEAWRIYTTLLDGDLPVHDYASGSWGPAAADRLTEGSTVDGSAVHG